MRLPDPPLGRPWTIGHRGAAAHHPENTAVAFEAAIRAPADLVETDVHLSADGELFLLHDGTLRRCTDVAVVFPDRADDPAESFTWDELRRLRIDGQPMLRLGELGEILAASGVGADIEVKPPILPSAGDVVEALESVLASRAWRAVVETGRVVVSSFDPAVLEESMAQIALPAALLVLAVPPDPPALAELAAMGVAGIVTDHTLLGRPEATLAHEAGLPIWVFTPNEPDAWDRMVGLGVSGICTDDPAALVAHLEYSAG